MRDDGTFQHRCKVCHSKHIYKTQLRTRNIMWLEEKVVQLTWHLELIKSEIEERNEE